MRDLMSPTHVSTTSITWSRPAFSSATDFPPVAFWYGAYERTDSGDPSRASTTVRRREGS